MLAHFVNFLVESFDLIPARIGSNWGGLVFAAILFFITEGVLWKWGEMKGHLARNTLIGFAIAGIGWTLLFFVSAFLTVYDDHQNMVGATARIKRSLNSELESTRSSLTKNVNNEHNSLIAKQLECARQQGQNDTLQKQNRDEQVLIAGCQSEAIKRLTPEREIHTPIALDVDNSDPQHAKSRWLIFMNKVVPAAMLTVTCDQDISAMTAKIAGGPPLPGTTARLSDKSWSIRITGSPWGPTSPVFVDIDTRGTTRTCAFVRQ